MGGCRHAGITHTPFPLSSYVGSGLRQYENSTDNDFILDRHPEAENVWIVGGSMAFTHVREFPGKMRLDQQNLRGCADHLLAGFHHWRFR